MEIETKSTDGRVLLWVDDSGPGIAEAERARVFERFYRVGGDRHLHAVGGCGLGLSIVQHIAEQHGANISLGDSNFGPGLSVQLRFPTEPAVTSIQGASGD